MWVHVVSCKWLISSWFMNKAVIVGKQKDYDWAISYGETTVTQNSDFF